MKRDYTKSILVKMLHENTGIHMMDSGGGCGRNWQRNKTRNFAKEPEITVDEYGSISRSTYHFLSECLEYNAELTAAFRVYSKKQKDSFWLADMEGWLEEIGAAGIYGEGKPKTINTYNHESLLDQVLQYTPFELGGKAYVILQIHGGADVRGGYTMPRVFRALEDYAITDDAYINAGCECGLQLTSTNAGYSWEGGNTTTNWEITAKDGKAICPKCGKELSLF